MVKLFITKFKVNLMMETQIIVKTVHFLVIIAVIKLFVFLASKDTI